MRGLCFHLKHKHQLLARSRIPKQDGIANSLKSSRQSKKSAVGSASGNQDASKSLSQDRHWLSFDLLLAGKAFVAIPPA